MNIHFGLHKAIPLALVLYAAGLTGMVLITEWQDAGERAEASSGALLAHVGNLLTNDIEQHFAHHADSPSHDLLADHATLPGLRHGLIVTGDDKIHIASDPRLTGRDLFQISPRPADRVLADVRRTLSARTWPDPGADLIWGIFPFQLPPESGQLRNPDVGLLLLALDTRRPREIAVAHLQDDLMLLGVGLAVFSLLLWLFLRRRVALPLAELHGQIEASLAGRTKRIKLTVTDTDEIADLANHFNRLLDTLNSRNTHLEAMTGQLHEEALAHETTAHTLRVSRDYYRGLVSHLPQKIFVKDCHSNYLSCNANYAADLGIETDQIAGRDDLEFFPRELAEKYRADDQAVIARGESSVFEEAYQVQGEARWIRTTKVPVRDEQNAVVIGLVGIIEDISERKQAEETQRLAASVFENSRDGIIVTDAERRIIAVNPAFSEVTGYTRAEAIGQTPRLLSSGRHDARFFRQMWRQLDEQGYWQGEIWDRRKNGDVYLELLSISVVKDAAQRVSHYIGLFTDISALKEAQSRLERLAHYDALTELPNRTLLTQRLEAAIARADQEGSLLAVAFLDLDDFKPVNDKHGHAVGDRLLMEVSGRLKAALRGNDTAARLGGDEFLLILCDIHDLSQLTPILDRLLASLSQPFAIMGQSFSISASIGVAVYPWDGADGDTLIRHADQAMYRAKQAGRNGYHLFDAEQDRQTRARLDELTRIRLALQQHEFTLHYQPKVDLAAGTVVGAEALIRWQDPERGLIPPGGFLPLIEGNDLIVEIGEWVLATALAQMAAWHAEGLALPVSVNVAARQLQHPDFVVRLRALLKRYPELPAGYLELEILESAALDDVERVRRVIREGHALGVRFAIDDFGTGYSSLAYLKGIPADVLKIDRSFIIDMLEDEDDRVLVSGIIGLARSYNREVIAEGVESAEHGSLLLHLGCRLAQGYGIARPMPAAQIRGWVAAYHPAPEWRIWIGTNAANSDLPLLTAQRDHLRWIEAIVDHVRGNPLAISADEVRDHTACNFGKWYFGPAQQRYGGLPEYQRLDKTHRMVHQYGGKIAEFMRQGDRAAAEEMLPSLLCLKDVVLEEIRLLQRAMPHGKDG